MEQMQKIRRTSVSAQAVAAIRAHITSGKVQPGDKLATETELSAMLGVGRSTVREAIRTLEAMGFVETRPGRGAFVRVVREDDAALQGGARRWFTESARTLAEFGQLREILEPSAARMAAEARTEADIAALGDALSAFDAALAAGDTAAMSEADRRFHTALMAASGNALLCEMYGRTAELFTAYSIRSFTAEGVDARRTAAEHRCVLDAVKGSDAAAAERAMRDHLSAAAAQIEMLKRPEE